MLQKLGQGHTITNQVVSGEKKIKAHLILTFDLTILQVSWIRKGDVVVLTHGTAVFTSDERVTVKQKLPHILSSAQV